MKKVNVFLLVGVTVAALILASCAPSDAEIREIVRAEIDRIEIPAGPQGPVGPAGVVGPAGAQGSQGEVGPQGPQGEVGPKSERGDDGPRGETGARGEVGPQGERGDPGLRGDEGPRGEVGIKGERGDVGPRGEPGPQGPQGEQGPSWELPASIEVEELIVRIPGGGGYLELRGGDEGHVAYVAWYDSDGTYVGQITSGSIDGMVLATRDSDTDSWTEFCINKGEIAPCPAIDTQ